MDLTFIIFILGAYLIGAIPFGLLLGKVKGVDIREHGSGNIGATNVGRVLGRKLGLLCFGLDVLKGLGPTLGYGLAAGLITSQDAGASGGALATLKWLGVAVAAIIGHVFPVYLKFHGGKGVATSLGALLGVFPVLSAAAVAGGLVWFITVKRTGYVSLASVLAAVVLPFAAVAFGVIFDRPMSQWLTLWGVTALLSLLVVVKHRSNLRRLKDGTEAKVDWAKKNVSDK